MRGLGEQPRRSIEDDLPMLVAGRKAKRQQRLERKRKDKRKHH